MILANGIAEYIEGSNRWLINVEGCQVEYRGPKEKAEKKYQKYLNDSKSWKSFRKGYEHRIQFFGNYEDEGKVWEAFSGYDSTSWAIDDLGQRTEAQERNERIKESLKALNVIKVILHNEHHMGGVSDAVINLLT